MEDLTLLRITTVLLLASGVLVAGAIVYRHRPRRIGHFAGLTALGLLCYLASTPQMVLVEASQDAPEYVPASRMDPDLLAAMKSTLNEVRLRALERTDARLRSGSGGGPGSDTR